MKGSHPRPADRCPFVLRHSISQVTSFMQLGMLWIMCLKPDFRDVMKKYSTIINMKLDFISIVFTPQVQGDIGR